MSGASRAVATEVDAKALNPLMVSMSSIQIVITLRDDWAQHLIDRAGQKRMRPADYLAMEIERVLSS